MTAYEFEPDSVDAISDDSVSRKKTILAGGYYDLGKNKYWIPYPLYDQVVERDNASPLTSKGDREFGKWLSAFIKENNIKPEKKEQNTRSLSGYWAMPYESYGGSYKRFDSSVSQSTLKMASVLRAMRSVVGVVDPEHKLQVKYNEHSSTSSWDAGSTVMLPLEPVNEIDDLEECINVMSGFSIHEAFHSQETRKLLDDPTREFLQVFSWNMYLANLLEDPRIEEEGLLDTPGYREYLNYVKEYLWSEGSLPKEWPEAPEERFRAAIGLIRYEDRIDDFLTHESFDEPRKWLRDWSRRYSNAQHEKPSGETLIKFVKEGLDFFGIDSTTREHMKMPMPCALVYEGDKIRDSKEEDVDKAIEEEKEGGDIKSKLWKKIFDRMPPDSGDGDGMLSVVVRRPKTSGKFTPKSSDLVEKAKAALTLRKVVAQHDTREQTSGVLDEDELYRFAGGDYRIFKDATVESLPSAAVYLLVDMSGSMGSGYGSAAYYATSLAQIFTQALTVHPHVTVRVLGHSGENDDNPGGGSFYRIWEKGDSLDRLSILEDRSLYSENYDSWAIAWAGNLLKQESATQKLLVVLADGSPSATAYGGSGARRHVRKVSDALARDGVSVVQVAVGPYLSEEDQKEMFKHYIAVPSSGDDATKLFPVILQKLTKLLRKVV